MGFEARTDRRESLEVCVKLTSRIIMCAHVIVTITESAAAVDAAGQPEGARHMTPIIQK